MNRPTLTQEDWEEIHKREWDEINRISLSRMASLMEAYGAPIEETVNGNYVIRDDAGYKRYSLYLNNNGVVQMSDFFKYDNLNAKNAHHPNSLTGAWNIMHDFIGWNGRGNEFLELVLGKSEVDRIRESYKQEKGMAYNETAVSVSTPDEAITEEKSPVKTPATEKKAFVEPSLVKGKKSRAFGYLVNGRGVDYDVVCDFVRNGFIGETRKAHAVAFLGNDPDGKLVFCQYRQTRKNIPWEHRVRCGTGSNKKYPFRWEGPSDRLYVFEAPIDMLSYISMNKDNGSLGDNWRNNSYIALCGLDNESVSAFLDRNPGKIKTVSLCLDNDSAGERGVEALKAKLEKRNEEISISVCVPEEKDWNEDLMNQKKIEREDPLTSLANDLDALIYDYDPYDYNDRYYDREDGLQDCKSALASGDVEDLYSVLDAIIADEENSLHKEAKELRNRLDSFSVPQRSTDEVEL